MNLICYYFNYLVDLCMEHQWMEKTERRVLESVWTKGVRNIVWNTCSISPVSETLPCCKKRLSYNVWSNKSQPDLLLHTWQDILFLQQGSVTNIGEIEHVFLAPFVHIFASTLLFVFFIHWCYIQRSTRNN